MQFLVGEPQEVRHARIVELLTTDGAVIAALLAAADFEWTIRRCIYALGCSPTAQLREIRVAGLNGYAKLWAKEVARGGEPQLLALLPPIALVERAMALRHELIHGVRRSTGAQYATHQVQTLLNASKLLSEYAKLRGVDISSRLRSRPRQPVSPTASGVRGQ